MKKFQFNLATVLRVREREEEAARIKLVKARELLNVIIKKIEALESEKLSVEAEWRNRSTTRGSFLRGEDYVGYLQILQGRIAEQQDELMRAQNIVEAKRVELEKISRKKKALENLKERKYAQWNEEYRTMERLHLDEVAVTRYRKDQDQMR